ncbi:hypothetical protein [Streptomyces bauhiniae]
MPTQTSQVGGWLPADDRRCGSLHGLCIVRALYDDDWYMGSLYDDGSVDCWTIYGNLHEAVRGL